MHSGSGPSRKNWPTFERECFAPRVADEAVIPIYLDDTVFPGIPQDIVGIKFTRAPDKALEDQVTDDIVFRLLARLDDV